MGSSFPTEESPGLVPPTNAMLLSASPSFAETDEDEAQRAGAGAGGGLRSHAGERGRGVASSARVDASAPAAAAAAESVTWFGREALRSVKALELQVREYQLQASREMLAFQEKDLEIKRARERQWDELVAGVERKLADKEARDLEREVRQDARQSEVLTQVASLVSRADESLAAARAMECERERERAPAPAPAPSPAPAPAAAAMTEELARVREELARLREEVSPLREKYEKLKPKAREYQRTIRAYEQRYGKLGRRREEEEEGKQEETAAAMAGAGAAAASESEQEVAETPPQEAWSPLVSTAVRVRTQPESTREAGPAAAAVTMAPAPASVEKKKEKEKEKESQPSPGWIPRRRQGGGAKTKGRDQRHLDEFFTSQQHRPSAGGGAGAGGDRKRGRARDLGFGLKRAAQAAGAAGAAGAGAASVIVLDDTPVSSNRSSQQLPGESQDTAGDVGDGGRQKIRRRPSGFTAAGGQEGFDFAKYGKYRESPKAEGQGTPKDFWHIGITPPD